MAMFLRRQLRHAPEEGRYIARLIAFITAFRVSDPSLLLITRKANPRAGFQMTFDLQPGFAPECPGKTLPSRGTIS
jgi:hypothetical protein